MTRPVWMDFWPAAILAVMSCFLSFAANGQTDSKQAVCQALWERCLGSGGGKNWKPIYDRCLKARTACLGGRAYQPDVPQTFSSVLPNASAGSGSLGDSVANANADPATQGARCADGEVRGARNACVLAEAGEGYGQAFSLLGPGVPLSRMQRVRSVVTCAGGKAASFYPNGRIESCILDNSGEVETRFTGTSGAIARCAPRSLVRFDAEGLLVSCGPP